MRQYIIDFFGANVGALTLQEIILNYLVAGILSIVIFVSYKISHAGTLYSARFNITLVMITLVTTTVMCVIGNNIALSLGMVGALSIIRFRTAVKDARDATYIFWTIAVGVCCGVSEYLIASIGSAFIFLFMLGLGSVKSNNRFLLIIRAQADADKLVLGTVDRIFNYKARLCVENKDENSLEFIYEISRKELAKSEESNGDAPTAIIRKLEGITSVSLVEQNDEVNQ